MAVVFDASTLPFWETEFEVTLTSAKLGAEVDTLSATITGIDASDPEVKAGLESDAEVAAAAAEPPPAVVLATLLKLAGSDGAGTLTPTPQPPPILTPGVRVRVGDGTMPDAASSIAGTGPSVPIAVLLAIGGALIALGAALLGWAVIRRRQLR